MKKVSVVIPSGGRGSRMGANKSKQFLLLKGKAILQITLEKFLQIEEVTELIVLSSREDMDETKRIINSIETDKLIRLTIGGDSRQDSVFNGLKLLSSSCDIVLVHDGARPLIEKNEIRSCIKSVEDKGSGVIGVPVKDTIKVVDSDGIVSNTPKRDTLWITQTPQGFFPQDLISAYEKAREEGFIGTDDSSLIERYGGKVFMVMGSYENIKLTTPEDLIIAERIMER
ncbi:MAG: 2-C-methyl-D-erythritol 4-phosphate cytidylyltransferase [Firmicutes bacterium]|nr:2-C-methyl-D-erythritol 4-phosphate cytidylyltransferase [Bacillota bacterium]